jgi:hypothetical protein
MKKSSIFAASLPKTNLHSTICGSYFYGCTDAALSKDIRLSIHNGLLHSCCNLSLARCGGVAFSILYTLIFHYMPKTMKNASKVNNSSHTSTPAERNTVPYSKFLIEKDAKNEAYYFILSNGLFDRFKEFCKNYHSDNHHRDCLNVLSTKGGIL